MRFDTFGQIIDFKGLFLIFCLCVSIFGVKPAFSQETVSTPADIIRDLVSGNLSVDDVVDQIQENLNIPQSSLDELEDVVNNIKDVAETIESFDIDKLGDTLANLAAGEIDISELEDLADTLENFADEIIDPELAQELLDKINIGEIPPELAEAISAFEDLRTLTDIDSLQDFLENPDVQEAFEGLLEGGQLPAEIEEAIAAVTDLVSDLEGSVDEIVAAVVESLPDDLVDALGGSEALEESLGGLISGGAVGGGISGGTGEGCGASCNACKDCAPKINENHLRIRAQMTSSFEQHRIWLVTTFFTETIAPAMALMTSQLITVGTQQVQAIGQFFDAKHQLETQRLFQTMTAQAHKDYHPSEGLCKIGTNSRSLAPSQRISDATQLTLAERMMNRQLLNGDTLAGEGKDQDRKSRLNMFIEKFCNKTDHAGALQELCKDGGGSPSQINMDINYTQAINNKLTLDIDPTDNPGTATIDEENIYALSANLFSHNVPPAIADGELINSDGSPTSKVQDLLNFRSVAAKRSVAQNSFAAITALKAEGDSEAAPFLKSILTESGINPSDIEASLGENPSYYAQMEVLTKDIYQNPIFYSNLYDKPANIERKSAALLALELMQDRDIYDSLLRSEAVIATMIELLIRDEQTRINEDIRAVGSTGIEMLQNSGAP